MSNAYKKFIEESEMAINNFPELQLCIREDSMPYLFGKIDLYDNGGNLYDNYSIRIECTNDYPQTFPWVYETSNRLPHNIDWHIYPDGHFCICTPLEEHIACAKALTLTNFIEKQVVPYLHNQRFREKEGYFMNERSHGTKGVLESIYDILGVNDFNKARAIMNYIYKNDAPLRTAMCFCGSNRKYRYCHKQAYIDIKSIGQQKLATVLFNFKLLNVLEINP